jgi:hypothetical protein
MVILNQIVGVGGFSIADNLRLIVIAAIFIGIIVVLLYLRVAKSEEKTNRKYISKEKTIKGKTGEDIEDIVEHVEETEEKPVVDFETIEEKIKNSEAGIITKFEAVIKDLRVQTDTKLTAEIEGLISKIEEREKEVVKKIESVIDTKVQEALNKMSDKVVAALYTQKSSTASVLEKLVDSLRTEEIPTGSLAYVEAEKGIEEISAKSKIQGSKATGSSNIEKTLKLNKTECEPAGISGANKRQEEKTFVPSDISGEIIENTVDFDMQAFLDAEPVSISSSGESNVVPDDIQGEEMKESSGNNTNVEIDDMVTGGMVGDLADFDIQAFLDELEDLPSEKDPEVEK